MQLHFPRQQSTSCADGKSFYSCAKGPYTGCCSTNPCDTGVCGDDSNSNPTTADTSNHPSPTDSRNLSTSTGSQSSATSRLTSSFAATGSIKPISTSTTLSATSTAPTAPSSSTPQPVHTAPSPVGAIVGGVLGGLALLALLATLLWCCLQRKSKLRISIGRAKKKIDKRREKEILEAEAAIVQREKFLHAAKQKRETEVESGDPFAEFGGSSLYPKNSTAIPPQKWN